MINKRKSIKDEQKVITDTIEELVTKKGGTEGYKFLMENGKESIVTLCDDCCFSYALLSLAGHVGRVTDYYRAKPLRE